MPVFVSSMDYRLWRIKSWLYALRYRLPWKRHALRQAIEYKVASIESDAWYVSRVKWARKLSRMSLYESKRFVDRCYGKKKRMAPDAVS